VGFQVTCINFVRLIKASIFLTELNIRSPL